jgi:phosphate transport system substrate-binding protein
MRGIGRAFGCCGLFLLILGCGGSGGSTTKQLNGSGATFVEPILKDWAMEYETVSKKSVIVDYQGGGSGRGVTEMTDKVTDFGCSDAPLTKSQLDKAKEKGGAVVHIPLVVGAVVVPYNLDEVKNPLVLSGEVLAGIFSKAITKWNDPKIAALNPGVNLPDRGIIVVVRADGSGTSNIFTEYLGKVDEGFRKAIPANSKPNWSKDFVAEPQSSGVINQVKKTPGAITYVELSYAVDSKLPFATIRNQKGKDIVATLETISLAADAALGIEPTTEPYSLHTLTYSLTNSASETAYPISALSYCVFYEKLDTNKRKPLVEFLTWATTKGQELSPKKHYAPLPESLQKKIAERLAGLPATKS